MIKSIKYINSLMCNVKSLKSKYEDLKKEIIGLTSQQEYEQTLQHYDKLITKFKDELLTLPIGYRYTGVFYIKNSLTIPAVFEKYDGVVYLREDLISWQIEKGLERPDYGYHRNIFKEPMAGAELRRADAVPIYEDSK